MVEAQVTYMEREEKKEGRVDQSVQIMSCMYKHVVHVCCFLCLLKLCGSVCVIYSVLWQFVSVCVCGVHVYYICLYSSLYVWILYHFIIYICVSMWLVPSTIIFFLSLMSSYVALFLILYICGVLVLCVYVASIVASLYCIIYCLYLCVFHSPLIKYSSILSLCVLRVCVQCPQHLSSWCQCGHGVSVMGWQFLMVCSVILYS